MLNKKRLKEFIKKHSLELMYIMSILFIIFIYIISSLFVKSDDKIPYEYSLIKSEKYYKKVEVSEKVKYKLKELYILLKENKDYFSDSEINKNYILYTLNKEKYYISYKPNFKYDSYELNIDNLNTGTKRILNIVQYKEEYYIYYKSIITNKNIKKSKDKLVFMIDFLIDKFTFMVKQRKEIEKKEISKFIDKN